MKKFVQWLIIKELIELNLNKSIGSKKIPHFLVGFFYGGERGIRTPGGDEPTQPFQGCTIDHSDTSPENHYILPSHSFV